MVNKLFQSHTYTLLLPAPFISAGVNSRRSDVKSKHRAAQTSLTLHAPTLRAALTVIKAGKGMSNAAIGRHDNLIFIERESSDGSIEAIVYNPNDGSFKASIFSDPANAPTAYSLGKSKKDGTALLMAAIVYGSQVSREAELNECMNNLSNYLDNPSTMDEDALSKCGMILCDNVYTRINSADTLLEDGIKAGIPSTSNLQLLTRPAIDRATYAPDVIIAGEFRVFKTDNVRKLGFKPVSSNELPGKYALSERNFAPEEQALIPGIEPWFIVTKDIVRICQHAHATTGGNQPMRNFMLRGPAGVGKTEGARAIAAALGLPYLSLTCSANTEVFDLLGQILPDIKGIDGDTNDDVASDSTVQSLANLPTIEDIQMDTATAYQMLTGVYDENIGIDEVYTKLVDVIFAAAKSDNNGADVTGQRFRYVETPLVKAMKYGYLIEIQEPSVIANPGVLVGLNSLLDNCKQIVLPTGETIQRHPDTVVVVTTNNDYSGCRDINQSVISRMNLVVDIAEPGINELVARVSAITGCTDEETLLLMANVISDIQTRCRELQITDGSCGMRELIAWVQSFMITNDLAESVRYTVLSSVSAIPENQADIESTCIVPKVA